MAPKWTDDDEDKWGTKTPATTAQPDGPKQSDSERFEEMLKRVESLIAQVDTGYNMFATGVELQPPRQRREQLDQLINTLQMGPRPTSTLWFRFTTIKNQYVTYVTRWDRMMKDIESGKIKRIVGPKRA